MDLSGDPVAPEVEKLMAEMFAAGIKLEGGSQYNKVFGILHKLLTKIRNMQMPQINEVAPPNGNVTNR